MNSSHFKHEIAPATRERQIQRLQQFREDHGEKGVATLRCEHVVALLASKKPSPRLNWLGAIRPMMKYAVEIGMIAADHRGHRMPGG